MICACGQRWRVLLLGIVLLLAGFPAHAVQAQGETPVVGPPSISGAIVAQILSAAQSPLAEYAADIYRLGAEATIDPAFALAIWRKESSFGTTGASARNLNMGNLICEAATRKTSCSGRWAVYATWHDAIQDWYPYIQRRYISRGLATVEAILPVYAPPSENDTALYINQVNQWMRAWGSGVVGTAPGGSGGGWLDGIIGGKMDDWIYQPLDQFIYTIERVIAGWCWAFDRGGLYLVDLIERWRATMVGGGFRGAIQAVADGMFGLTRNAFQVGLVLGLLLLLLQPIIKLRLINIRKLLVFALVAPLALPAAGGLWQDLEQFRADLGSLIYDQVFTKNKVELVARGGSGAGLDQDMAELTPFDPTRGDAKHGIDAAAAYLFAVRADVVDPASPPPSDLPDTFAQIYFPQQPDELSRQEPAERQRAIQWAGQGIARLAFGALLVLFAVCESATNLLFTIGLGFLLIGLLISFVFGYLVPVEHIFSGLGRQALEVFIASWGISALQALVMAVVFGVAGSRDANAMLGIGILALVLEFIFLVVAFKTLVGAILGAGGSMTGGALTGETATAGAALAGASVGMAGATLLGGVAGGVQAQQAASATKLSYDVARREGNSRTYAASYALSGLRPMRQIGTLAVAMGKLPEHVAQDMERGLYAGGVVAQGEPLSLRGFRAVRRDAPTKAAAPGTRQEQPPASTSPTANIFPLTPEGGEQSVITTYPDGRTVTDWGGGYTETRHPDGRTVQRWPSGYEQTVPGDARGQANATMQGRPRGQTNATPTAPAEPTLNLQPLSMLQAGTLAQQQTQFGAATGAVRQILAGVSPEERREGLEAIETVIAPMQAREAEQAFFRRDGAFDAAGRGARHVQALLSPNHPWRTPDALAPLVEVALGRRDERGDLARAIGNVVEINRDPQRQIPPDRAAAEVARSVGMPRDAFRMRTSAINRLVQTSAAADVPGALVEQLVGEVAHSADQQPSEATANAIRTRLRGQLGPKDAEQHYQNMARLARHVPTSLAGLESQPAAKSRARIYDQTTA